MDIKTVLPTIQTFASLRPIVEQADVHLSFFGSRYVTVRGYEGYLTLDAIPKRVFEMLRQQPNIDEQENSHGRALEDRMTRIYERSDELVAQSNCFTWLMVTASDLTNEIYHLFCLKRYTTRYSWDGYGVRIFGNSRPTMSR